MASILAGDAEVTTGLLPLDSMGLDSFSPRSGKGDEMGEFVQESISQFLLARSLRKILKAGIQLDTGLSCKGPARRRPHTRIPGHRNDGSKRR